MNILITKGNYKDLPRLAGKNDKTGRIIIKWGNDIPRFSDLIFFLQEALDKLILKGIPFKLYNVPFCFMLGYKRYIGFDNSKFQKNKECGVCAYNTGCKGVPFKYYKLYGSGGIKPVSINTYFTDLEKCMIKVLNSENNIPSERVLEIAKRFTICAGCSDGNHVLITGEKLVRKNIVKRTFKTGSYYWQLLKNPGHGQYQV